MAATSGALLHVAVGRGEASAAAGVLAITALAVALRRSPLHRSRSGAAGLARRAELGWGTCLGIVAGLATWIPSAGFVVAGAQEAGAPHVRAIAIALLVSLLHALRLGLAGLVATRLQQGGVPIGLATCGACFAAEVVDRAPMPWSLGAATVDEPWISAAADLGGPAMAGLVLGLAGGVIADAIDGSRRPGRRPRLARLVGPIALAALMGRGMIATRDVEHAMSAAPKERVAAVHTEWRRGTPRVSPALVRATVDAASRDADVVVLPEALFWFTSEPVAREVLRATFDGVGADVLAGAGWGPASGGVNAVGRVAPGASGVDWYVKSRPFPVGEASDDIGTALGLSESPGVVVRGDAPATETFLIRGHTVAPAICWEDLFADAGVRAATAGPSWIAGAINDGWFTGSRIGTQHLQHARIRAVEARRALIRATNEGATAIVDPLGGVAPRAPGGAYVSATIPLLDERTIAVRTRCAIAWALAAIVLAAAMLVRSPATSAAS